jgi:hypothetical protein
VRFVGAMHVNVDLEGRARGYFFDLEREPDMAALYTEAFLPK